MGIELHVLQGGSDIGILPSYESLDISPVFCDYGSISFTYPKNGKRFASLLKGKDEVEVVPYIDGVAYPRLGGLVQEMDGDDVAEAGITKYNGTGYLTLLDEALVYPYNWPDVNPLETSWTFLEANAGIVVRALVQAAQSRGALEGVTLAFTTATDSNGVAWDRIINIEVKPGATLTDVLKGLHEQGMCEFVMNGRELRMHVVGGLSTDRTEVTPPAKPLVFRKGRDIRDSPRKTSTRELATVMLAAGKEDTGMYHEEVDSAAVASRRRIEGYVSNGNITDTGTLNAFSEYNLSQRSQPKMEKSHGLEFVNPKSPRPVVNFDVGDWCYSDTGEGLEKLRIKQWVLSVGSDGHMSGSVTLNDLFAEMSERLAKRIDGIVGGTTITGGSTATEPIPDEVLDLMPPRTPQGLSLASTAYTDERAGQTYAQISASWIQVTQNEDGTVIDDLAGHEIRWRYTDEAPGYRMVTVGPDQTVASWSPLTTDVEVEAEIRAFDNSGNRSGWSNFVLVQTGYDADPPERPAAPVVDNYLGLIRILTSGETESGAAWPPDFNYIEVHASKVASFAGDDTTVIDTVTGAGRTFTNPGYGETLYIKLRAVDDNGNKSPFTDEVSATASQILGDDVFDGAIGTAKLADLAVTTAKIGLLAVNTAQVGSMDVGKLTAGTLLGQVILGNRITTAATGTRAELNQIGFQAWNGTVQTIDLNGVNNLLTGIFKTASSGRRIEIGSAGTSGRIDFWAPDGTRGEIGVFTGGNVNVEAMRFGIDDPTVSQFWKKLQINEDSSSVFATGYMRNIVGGGGPGNQGFYVDWTPTQKTPADPFFDDADIESRIAITANTNIFKHPASGSFQVWQTQSATVDRARFSIDSGGFVYWDPNAINRFYISSTGAYIWGSDGHPDLDFTAGSLKFRPGPSTDENMLEVWQNPLDNESPRLRFWTNSSSSSSGVYACILKFTAATGIEVRLGDDSGYDDIYAFSHQTMSDMSLKRNVKAAKKNFLDGLAATEVKTYTMQEKPDRQMIGLLAQDAPAEFVTVRPDGLMAIDLYQMNSWLWGAVRELNDKVQALEGNKK